MVLTLHTLIHLTWKGCEAALSPILEICQLRPGDCLGLPSTSPDSAEPVFAASHCSPATLFRPC